MSSEEKYAKLLALSVLYEKQDIQHREKQLRRIACRPQDIGSLLDEIHDDTFKEWVRSVSHLFRVG